MRKGANKGGRKRGKGEGKGRGRDSGIVKRRRRMGGGGKVGGGRGRKCGHECRQSSKTKFDGNLTHNLICNPPCSQSKMQLSKAFLCHSDRLRVSYLFSTCAKHNHHTYTTHTHPLQMDMSG